MAAGSSTSTLKSMRTSAAKSKAGLFETAKDVAVFVLGPAHP
jgi:hypothetical protein